MQKASQNKPEETLEETEEPTQVLAQVIEQKHNPSKISAEPDSGSGCGSWNFCRKEVEKIYTSMQSKRKADPKYKKKYM